MKITLDLPEYDDEVGIDLTDILHGEIEHAVRTFVRARVREELQRKNAEITRAIAHRLAKIDYESGFDNEVDDDQVKGLP